MTGSGRIDVHQHLVPRVYRSALQRHGLTGGPPVPDWSRESAVALMDRLDIATSVLSISTPGVGLGAAPEPGKLAAAVNEAQAELVKDRPDRFGMFASVPLPDVDAALAAVAHAYDDLGAHGVVLMANSRGRYLGDPSFDPLMAELDRRHAVVFVHPGELPAPPADGVPPFTADFLLDTTRAAISLLTHGVLGRCSNVRFILAHGGGFVPYAAHRIAMGLATTLGVTPTDVLADLAGFYYDTALTGSPAALPSLLAFAPPDHVLFGSDWPFAPDPVVSYFTGGLDAYDGLDDAGRSAIDHDNAIALLPGLRRTSGP